MKVSVEGLSLESREGLVVIGGAEEVLVRDGEVLILPVGAVYPPPVKCALLREEGCFVTLDDANKPIYEPCAPGRFEMPCCKRAAGEPTPGIEPGDAADTLTAAVSVETVPPATDPPPDDLTEGGASKGGQNSRPTTPPPPPPKGEGGKSLNPTKGKGGASRQTLTAIRELGGGTAKMIGERIGISEAAAIQRLTKLKAHELVMPTGVRPKKWRLTGKGVDALER